MGGIFGFVMLPTIIELFELFKLTIYFPAHRSEHLSPFAVKITRNAIDKGIDNRNKKM